ncbi:hypothetical protein [Halanaerobium sp. ST460_2HS_T2]|uniref:hypothetical protein n=1 Tax=Halanaerobium sp. ST460_2HS_T2 TaxID=2183914 RepID=UPI0011C053BB|nr:hypothetical protein [Halanaerobium sp. ST460_2HS_T2]
MKAAFRKKYGPPNILKIKELEIPKPKEGVYVSSELGYLGQNLLLALITHIYSSRKVIFPVPTNIKESIIFINKLIKEDKFKAVMIKDIP